MGIKRRAQILAGYSCHYYDPLKKKDWKKISKSHNRILAQVSSIFESKGYKCHSECEIDPRKQGRADILCINSKDRSAVLIEVKSYDLYNSNRADLIQLLLYNIALQKLNSENGVELTCENGRKRIYLPHIEKIENFLVYKYDNRLIMLKISLDSIIGEDLYSMNIEHSYKYKRYSIGTWCKYCNYNECPFKRL